MAATVIPMPKFMAFSDAGAPLSAGLVYTYAAGTTTPLATYSDSDLTTPNANPVVLDSAGRATIYLTASSYKIVLKNSAGATVYTQDNIIAAAPYNVDLDVPITAGEVLTAGQAIYLSDGTGSRTAGRWYLTDSDTAAYSTVPITGFVTTALALGEEGSVRLLGQATVPGPVSVGLTYYLSGTPGAISTSAGTFVKNMGTADSTTTLIMTVATPVTPGGSNTYVQFNDAGVLGGDAGFTYIKATDAVAIGGPLAVTGATTLSSTVATGALTVTGAATVSTTLGVTGAITSATSVALTGTTNNLGTITTGVWNAGAVTSSGDIGSNVSSGTPALYLSNLAGGGGLKVSLDYAVATGRARLRALGQPGSGDVFSLRTSVAGTEQDTLTINYLGNTTLSGLLSVSGFGTSSFSAGGTGANSLKVANTTAGTTNSALVLLGNDLGDGAALRMFSSTFTTSGPNVANSLKLDNSSSGGLSLAATHASGAIRFYSGGTTQQAILRADGNWGAGTGGSAGIRFYSVAGASKDGLRADAETAGNVAVYGVHSSNSSTGYAGYFNNSGASNGQYIANSGSWVAISDRRRKTDINDLDALAGLKMVRPRDFLWQSQAISDDPMRRNFGFIAQEVAEVFPNLVTISPDGFFGVSYEGLIAPLVQGWQQHDATIVQLAARIAALETKDH